MRKTPLMLLLLPCALALSSCAALGGAKPKPLPPSDCPRLPEVSAAMMEPSTSRQQVRAELIEQPGSVTHK